MGGQVFFTACNDDDTYQKRKERENSAIASFLNTGVVVKDSDGTDTVLYVKPIKAITEDQFFAQDSTTDTTKNEYVLLNSTGIYMQIINKGIGSKITSGETAKIVNRFLEYNISGDSLICRNNYLYYIAVPDIMAVKNSYGVFSASYISGVMKTQHSSTVVPEGWLAALPYIRIGRPASADDKIAKVRVIVPHNSGTTDAQNTVFACFYEITYERGR